IISDGDYITIPDYVIVEVAVYPVKGRSVVVSHQDFTLRINGKKTPIFPQTPGMVAASVKYEDWERRPTVIGAAGAGGADVVLGRPRATERFPGDPRPRQERLPNPPRAPEPDDRSGVDKAVKRKPEEVIVACALHEGEIVTPIRGTLYYA